MNFVFEHFQKKLAEMDSSHTLGYFSIVHGHRITNPLRYAMSNHAIRILYLMLGREGAREMLCLGYHLGAIYPAYQWVLFHASPDGEACDLSDLLVVLDQTLFLGYHGWTGGREGSGIRKQRSVRRSSNLS